jgi:hypothetical protein
MRILTLMFEDRGHAVNKFFIVGCPRSGTTMLQQALNRHSQVAIPPETKFFFSFLGHSRRGQARHVRRLNEDLGIRLPEPAARVSAPDDARAYYELMARLYLERLGKRGDVCFGEKTPEHTGQLRRIRQVFPEARVIVLYRDGRDVASSLSQVDWGPGDVCVSFLVWLYYHQVVQAARRAGLPNLYVVRYEDIVADPERELGGILSFLGLPYEPAVARGHGNLEGVPQREYAWKERALGRISADRVEAFRDELSGDQLEVVERLGRHALPSLGYPLVTGGARRLSPGAVLELSFNLARFLCRLPWRSALNEALERLFGPACVEPALAPLPSVSG